jgi:hypothetical protein
LLYIIYNLKMFEKMADNLLTNKYFCLALLSLLIIVVYLYVQQKSCDVETMRNVDLTPLAQEISEEPWANNRNGSQYHNVGGKFDKYADAYTKNKLKENGYSYTNFLGRSDDSFRKYMQKEGYGSLENMPLPLDTHPELSQCQPCNCAVDDLMATSESPKKKHKKKKSKHNKRYQ